MRVAISGHRNLTAPVEALVHRALHVELSKLDPTELVGISCLADGADQIFARAVLERGGTLEAVVPAEKYRDGLPPEAWETYDELLVAAARVRRLPYRESTEESHMAASELMLEDSDLLLAVWDGQPARGYGGTADVVSFARNRGIAVTVIWPEGAYRT